MYYIFSLFLTNKVYKRFIFFFFDFYIDSISWFLSHKKKLWRPQVEYDCFNVTQQVMNFTMQLVFAQLKRHWFSGKWNKRIWLDENVWVIIWRKITAEPRVLRVKK